MDLTAALVKILLPLGGSGIDSPANPNFTDQRVVCYLWKCGREFSRIDLEIYPLANRSCHANVTESLLITSPGYWFAHGFALGTDGLWYVHSWGLRSGHVVETCPLKGAGRVQYFGFEFPAGINVNAVHGGLGAELSRLKLVDVC